MDAELAARLEKLESHLAHLEHQHEQINQVVIDQAKTVARLRTQLQKISQAVETAEVERIKATSSKPPHYQ